MDFTKRAGYHTRLFGARSTNRSGHVRSRLRFETLEEREMLSVAPEEQYFVYLLNRARHDPVAYQQEQNLSVDLAYVAPRAPLAVNSQLFASAEVHVNDMVAHNYFGHFSPFLNEWPNKMVRDQGYPLPYTLPIGPWTYLLPDDSNQVESAAAGRSSAVATLNDLIVDQGISPRAIAIICWESTSSPQ